MGGRAGQVLTGTPVARRNETHMSNPHLTGSERRLLARLAAAGATHPLNAHPLPALSRISSGWLPRLVRADFLVESAPGLYYLNLTAYIRYRRRRLLSQTLCVLGVGALVGLLLLFVRRS